MEARAKELIKRGDYLFSKKLPYDNLCQTIAENFCPDRADFTQTLNLDDEFADHLTTSFPLTAHRDLANAFGSLRPNDKQWFYMGTAREGDEDNMAKRWLEDKTRVMRRAMYDRVSQFTRATKEGDRDYAAFGQCVISTELNYSTATLLYRCWHIRDMSWCENGAGIIDTYHRKWKPTAQMLSEIFKDKIHSKVKQKLEKEPYCEINCRHVVVPAEKYSAPSEGAYGATPDKKKWRTPYVSVYIDVDNQHVMEETGIWNTMYSIPRWATKSGSQYAWSPATMISLPDARLLQSMSLTLLEAGEKAVNPPLVATEEVVRSDVQAYAGGITWVDSAYDERLGEALRPMTIDKSGLSFGLKMNEDTREMLSHGMFLNQLRMPQITKEMTAYESSQVVAEWIRQAQPVIEPTNAEYNGQIAEITFDVLLRGGAFGSPYEIPQSLRNADIQFKFESPIRDSEEKQKAQIFLESKAALAEAAQLDPTSAAMLDAKVALRDVLSGIRTPATWVRSEKDMEQIVAQMQQEQEMQKMMGEIANTGAIAEQAGKGISALREGGAI